MTQSHRFDGNIQRESTARISRPRPAQIKVNPGRIAWCCDQTNITLAELGEALNISAERLQEGNLTFNQMCRLERHFGCPPYFFKGKGRPKNPAHAVKFRTTASQQGISLNPSLFKIIGNAQTHIGSYADLMREWRGALTFAPPALSGTIEEKARQTREWLGLRDDTAYGFEDYRRLVEEKDILVVRSQGYMGEWRLDHPSVVGFSMPDGEAPLIFVKKTTPEMQAFTLFHELGHLLLHGKRAHIDGEEVLHGDHHARQEQEANRFAARCLVPESALNAADIPKRAAEFDNTFHPIAKRLGISVEVIVQALFDNKRIGRQQYDRYQSLARKQRAEKKPLQAGRAYGAVRHRHREPLGIFGMKYVRTMLDALNDGELTLSESCGYLGRIQAKEVRALERHLLDA